MISVDLRVLFVDRPADFVSLTDQLVDYQLLRDKQEHLVRWNVLLGCESDQLPVAPKAHWIVNSWELGSLLLEPSQELLVLDLALQFSCLLLVDDGEGVKV